MKVKIGSKIWFEGEKQPFTVRACDERFAVCTKPFNLQKTVFYTIVDFKEKIRGTENLIFSRGFKTDEQCNEALGRLNLHLKGDELHGSEISYRNRVLLKIVRIEDPAHKGLSRVKRPEVA